MLRGAAIFLLLNAFINQISAKYFSEAGGYHLPAGDSQPEPEGGEPIGSQYYDLDLGRDNLSPYQPQQPYPNNYDGKQKLADIVEELGQIRSNPELSQDEYQQMPQYDWNEENKQNGQFDLDALKNLPELAEKDAEKEKPEAVFAPKTPIKAEKKGQNEFETFVEPKVSKQLKDVEFMDKRVPAESFSRSTGVQALHSSGNIVFIAIVTMCCVVVVVGVVGGTYYYNHARKNSDNTFDDFTRYSPAGPGRDKKQKKTRGGSGNNITENGDESLAYKAQLHHYQQTKQKIIGAEEGMGGLPGVEMEDDKSDDELEEHNFSVYECPGLAPTGDIEVQNPNFDIKHHNASSP